jgi:hypothetical protein
MTTDQGERGATRRLRAPQELAAGVFLVVLAALALVLSSDLPMGTLRAMGPGMAPRAVAALVGAVGVAIAASAFFTDGEALSRWHLRGPLMILGAVAAFALTIRTAGLVVAGPLAIVIASFASPEVRWKEAVIFAVAMTAACILLFKVALKLPIPVATFL